MSDLADHLTARGYTRVPLTRSGVGHFHTAGPVGLDFEDVNAPLRAQGSAEVEVILGVDVFDAHAAVIDSSSQSLFLRAVAGGPVASPTGRAKEQT